MKLLTMENWHELAPWLKKANYKEYNSNCITMLMWNKTYPIYYKLFDHFALVYFAYHQNKHWFAPYCEKEYWKEATDTMLEYSQIHQIPFGIHSITQEYKDFLEATYPMQVVFENHISAEDYVYDRTQQETLSGKKMQKRRNHYNAFLKENENRFSYFPLSEEHFPAIYDLLKRWQQEKDDSESITEEEYGIHFLLDHFQELPLLGGCIYINEKLEAFSIASLISDDMIQIHVEKANRNIRGLYIAILKHFLETLPKEVTLINREDDMDLPSLRKAKHDMKPLYKVKKYFALFDKVTITHPTDDDLYAMQDLWRSSFTDENEETTQFFFQNIYQSENTYLIKNSSGLMGMTFINPWTMRIKDKRTNVLFLEGVAIEEDYKRCGVMKKLLRHILDKHKEEQFALQAYNWDIYKPLGFQVTHSLQKTIVDNTAYTNPEGLFMPCNDTSILFYLYEEYTEDKEAYRIRDLSYYTYFYSPYQKACGNQILVYQNDETIEGYICSHESEDTIYVEEIIYTGTKALHNMLSLLTQNNKNIIVTAYAKETIHGKKQLCNALMMNPPLEKEDSFFLNEIL